MMQRSTILGIIALVAVTSYITYDNFPIQQAQAQQPQQVSTQTFVFAKDFQDAILNGRYQNGEEIAVNLTTIPQDVIIQRWDEIPTARQNIILAQANLAGYVEFTP